MTDGDNNKFVEICCYPLLSEMQVCGDNWAAVDFVAGPSEEPRHRARLLGDEPSYLVCGGD